MTRVQTTLAELSRTGNALEVAFFRDDAVAGRRSTVLTGAEGMVVVAIEQDGGVCWLVLSELEQLVADARRAAGRMT